MDVRTGKTPCAGRGRFAIRLRAGALLLFVLVSLPPLSCVGDLVGPTLARVVYTFAAPFPDTAIDVGDSSRVLPCPLTADGREVSCRLEVTVANGNRNLRYERGRIVMDSLGAAVIVMRPVNGQLPNDTIVRTATVHGFAPQVRFGLAGTEDTLIGVGQEKLLIAMATTKTGRIIMGAPIRWTQDSGAGVAMLSGNAPGWIRALSNGVAVFRASTDTASAVRRVVVRLVTSPTAGRPASGVALVGNAAAPGKGAGP